MVVLNSYFADSIIIDIVNIDLIIPSKVLLSLSFFFMKDMTTAILVPCPDAAYPVRIVVALKPTQVAQGVDEIIFEEYKNVITHGALAYLQQMPEKTWSNPNMSVFYQGLFDADVQEAKLKSEKGYALRKTFRTQAHFI